MRFGIPIAAFVVAIAAWHGYLWLRFVRDTGPARAWRRAAAAALVLLGTAAVLALSRPRWLRGDLRAPVNALGYTWAGISFLLGCALLLVEPLRAWLAARARRAPGPDAGRRRTLARVLGGGAALAGGGAALAGVAEAKHLVVARLRVPLAKLPASMSGTRIVQISDVHFGAASGPAYLAHIVAMVNALEPDLVAITGDLVDGTVAVLGPTIAPLRELRARYGVFFVTGNHEYYSGAAAWVAHLPSLGVRVLQNERVSIGGPEGSFDLAGVSDLSASDHGGRHDMPLALAGRDPSREVVLLAHQPSSLYEASRLGVGLQLSGHTHGGQLYPLRYVLMFDQPFVDGLHRLRDTWVYVTRGAGYWGPPMRLGAPPEVAEITLVSA